MAENVKVIVRCRPLNKNEINQKKIVHIDDLAVRIDNPAEENTPPKCFTFDSVYDDIAPTEALYNDICYPLVESVLEGFNATIFAYGQTGCGKSHTMQGPPFNWDTKSNMLKSSQRGIISRSFEHIFEAINLAQGSRFLALVSYLEIYNENIRDLLCSSKASLPLKEDAEGGIVVQNLTQHPVHNVEECEKFLELGNKNRAIGNTNMNATSSRSHSIFTICVEQMLNEDGNEATDDLELLKLGRNIKRGKLNLVDLAGSERQAKTGATGERLKEATKINLSLSALGNVISALVDGKTKHIPYRDSKLTRLLQDSLGGNTKTLMVACISPASSNYDETLSTLRYANRAKNISNKPTLNEDPTETMLRKYREEILKLKSLLNISENQSIDDINVVKTPDKLLEVEREKLRQEYEKKSLELKRMNENQQQEKENLVREMENLKVYYENKLNKGMSAHQIQNNLNNLSDKELTSLKQEEIVHRINQMKSVLIGGERASDVRLMEKRKKRKTDVENRQKKLQEALSRIEGDDERELLQETYSDIEQELNIKTEALKARRQKIRVLEREIQDLQSEFQIDRADYLESIRRMERNQKFYQQLLDVAVPLLRKDNRIWDVDMIKANSEWIEDTKKWILPEESMQRLKLPPAMVTDSAPGRLQSICISVPSSPQVDEESRDEMEENGSKSDFLKKKLNNMDNQFIVDSYFRPKRANELLNKYKKNSQSMVLNKTWTNGEVYSSSARNSPSNRNIQNKLNNF